jgi:hypothetical protein
VSFSWWTEESSAKPGEDYVSPGRRTGHLSGGQQETTIFIPIISDSLRPRLTQFQVALASPADHGTAPARTTVTIERG